MKQKNTCIICEATTILHDAKGNPWCEAHKQRCDLMNWGHAHGWPLVNCQAKEDTVDMMRNRFRYYNIGPEYAQWFFACSMGRQHMIETLSTTIFVNEEL